LLLVDILNPAIIDESADPVPISADRTGLGATVTLPHAPNIREPLRIRPPGLHQASLSLAHTVVHKNQNAPLIAAMTAQVGRVRDIIRSDVAEESAQCTHMLTLLKIKRGSGQCALCRARDKAHGRRAFFKALNDEPTGVGEALEQIKALYAVEDQIRDLKLCGEAKQLHRLTHSKPLVERFFEWVDQQLVRQDFTPSNRYIKALNYVRGRRIGLEVFLTDPDVPIDTNHLERALRVVPMGRKSWLFCWTELGAKHVGVIQSLIVTCRLHGIDPYAYLVDVLQRISEHPASRVAELTPRLWKEHFAAAPLRSDLADFPTR
jgi:hypothetical protein